MAAAAILKFRVNGHNSAPIARICTKFDTEIQNGVLEAVLPSKFTSNKIQYGGGRHFEIHINGYNMATIAYISTKFDALMAITRPFLHIFARNFASGLKITFRKQICRQCDFRQNPRWRRRRK